MKTILQVAKYYYPDLGGTETVTRYLAEGLTEYRNVVTCFSTGSYKLDEVINKVEIHRMPVSFRLKSQDVSFSYFFRLMSIIKDIHPDIIVVHCPNPFVYPIVNILKPKKAKLVLLWHLDILGKGSLYKIISPFETQILKKADLILTTSPIYAQCSGPLQSYKDKVEVLPNGIITTNFEKISDTNYRIKYIKDLYNGKPIVLFVGRHIMYKGLEYLIEAEKYIKSECEIVIAGEGPLTNNLKSLSISNRIHFVGRLSDGDLQLYALASDIFAFPSINKAEAFGIALAEAMYAYCVPVTFEIQGSGVNWVSVNGETGITVPLKDAKSYAEAIDKLLTNEDLRLKMAQAAHDRVQKMFTDVVAVNRARTLFSQVLKK